MPERSRWQMVGWAAAAALLVLAATRWLAPGGGDQAPPPVRLDAGGARGASAPSASGARRRELYVHVVGSVRRPGVYRVPDGSRVAAAVARAGGPTRRADLAAVNLAQPLQDGRQVIVPAVGAGGAGVAGAAGAAGAGSAASGAPGATPAAGSQLSLATASAEQLDGLDGIGPTLAKRIVDYREAHGGFRSVEQLREVEGIGEKRFAALKDSLQP